MARTGAIVTRWSRVTPGREAMALDAFGATLGYYEELSKEGRIIAHREYFAQDGSGMMILEGLLPELHRLVQEDDYVRALARGNAVVEGLQTDIVAGGSDQTIQEMMALVVGVEEELGLL